MFICRSGGRSHQAAATATESGYANCYNILEGFEGDKDATGHRGTKGGWKAAGFPGYRAEQSGRVNQSLGSESRVQIRELDGLQVQAADHLTIPE